MDKKKLELTAVFIEDEGKGFTAYIEEIPTAVTQGDTIDEAKANLVKALNFVLMAKRKEGREETIGTNNITRQPLPILA